MQDIADRAGVAKSTVSLALRDSPKISLGTRGRVAKIAHAIGYRRDPVVAALATRRFKPAFKIQVLLVRLFERKCIKGYSLAVWDSCGNWARQMGYEISDIDVTGYATAQALERVLDSRGVRGILLFPFFGWKDVEQCTFAGQAVVMANFGSIDLPTMRVRPHVAAHVRLCYAKALSRGRQRIGLMIPTQESRPSDIDQAALGAIEYCYQHLSGGGVRIPPFMNFTKIGDRMDALAHWIRQHRIDCVIGWNAGYINVLRGCGLRVPQDVAFVAITNNCNANQVAGIIRDPVRHGEVAVDLLDREIRYNRHGMQGQYFTVLLEGVWQDGPTLPIPEGAEKKG